MNHERPSAHSHGRALSQLVDRAGRHWEARRHAAAAQRDAAAPAPPHFTVALSRELGTNGTAVAHEVGRLLGWHVYDNELLERIAQDMGLRNNLLNSVDERHQTWLGKIADAVLAAPVLPVWGSPVTEGSFVYHLIKTVLALGVHGESVIVGRGAAFILPAETTLRVRLVGSVRERVAVLSRRLSISEHEAAKQARAIDRERNDFVQDHFRKDPADPRNYDLVLNAPRLSVRQNAELVVEVLHRLQAHAVEREPVPADARLP
jgi:cytidylate kinase